MSTVMVQNHLSTVTGIQCIAGYYGTGATLPSIFAAVHTGGSNYVIRCFAGAAGVHAQVGSDLAMPSTSYQPTNIAISQNTLGGLGCLIGTNANSNDAIIVGSLYSTPTIITNTLSGSACRIANRNGQIAFGGNSAYGFAITQTAGTLVKFDPVTPAITVITVTGAYFSSLELFSCISVDGSKNGDGSSKPIYWLGTDLGRILAMLENGTIIASFTLPNRRRATGAYSTATRSIIQIKPINVVSGSSNQGLTHPYLLVQTSFGEIFLMDGATGQILQEFCVGSSGTGTSPCLIFSDGNGSYSEGSWNTGYGTVAGLKPTANSSVFCGESGVSISGAASTTLFELDVLLTPMVQRSFFTIGDNQGGISNICSIPYTSNRMIAVCRPSSNTLGWYVPPTSGSKPNDYFYNVTSISLGGIGHPGEMILINDSVSPSTVERVSTIPSGPNGRSVPTNLSATILVGKNGVGTDATFSVGRSSTL